MTPVPRHEFIDLIAALNRMGHETATRVVGQMTSADRIELSYANMLWCVRRAEQVA
jgi:hypothetical protein